MTPASDQHLRPAEAAGFTLVELLVTMTIGVILMALAVPSYTSSVARTKTRGMASELSLSLSRTRSEALTRNASVTLAAKSGSWNTGWTMDEVAVSGPHIEERGITGGVSVTGPTSVSYTASGRLSSAPPVFVIASQTTADATTCVSVDLSGRPYSRKGAAC